MEVRSRAGNPPARIETHALLPSTNSEALARGRAGERSPLWISAHEQTAGRGREGRVWASLPGNLHASVLLVDPAPPARLPELSFVAGLAAYDAVAELCPALRDGLALKWPNDLFLRGRKLAGVLAESEASRGRSLVAIGFGINCAAHPSDLGRPATDLAAEGAAVAAADVLGALVEAFARRVVEWDRGAGFAAIRTAWLARALGLGQAVSVRTSHGERRGVFEALDPRGCLILVRDGQREVIAAGDVLQAGVPQ